MSTMTKQPKVSKKELRADLKAADDLVCEAKDECERVAGELREMLRKHGIDPDGDLRKAPKTLRELMGAARAIDTLSMRLESFSGAEVLDE